MTKNTNSQMFYGLLKIRFDLTSTNSKQVGTKTHLSTNPDMSVPLFYYKEFQKNNNNNQELLSLEQLSPGGRCGISLETLLKIENI